MSSQIFQGSSLIFFCQTRFMVDRNLLHVIARHCPILIIITVPLEHVLCHKEKSPFSILINNYQTIDISLLTAPADAEGTW